MVDHPHVERCSETGRHVVRGSRVHVARLWAWHRKGVTVETLVKRYPSLGWAKILSALAWAYDHREAVEAQLELDRRVLMAEHPSAPPPLPPSSEDINNPG